MLRAISTSVNYFTFPTMKPDLRLSARQRRDPRQRLRRDAARPQSPRHLARRHPDAGASSPARSRVIEATTVARAFTFFDCTDYIDGTPPKGMLTEALNFKRNDPDAAYSPMGAVQASHPLRHGPSRCAWRLFRRRGRATADLPPRLSRVTIKASWLIGGQDAMLRACADHQIRVVAVRPAADAEPISSPEPMDLSDNLA